jgi:hypothetical protein
LTRRRQDAQENLKEGGSQLQRQLLRESLERIRLRNIVQMKKKRKRKMFNPLDPQGNQLQRPPRSLRLPSLSQLSLERSLLQSQLARQLKPRTSQSQKVSLPKRRRKRKR